MTLQPYALNLDVFMLHDVLVALISKLGDYLFYRLLPFSGFSFDHLPKAVDKRVYVSREVD